MSGVTFPLSSRSSTRPAFFPCFLTRWRPRDVQRQDHLRRDLRGRRVYRWQRRDLGPLRPEPHLAARVIINRTPDGLASHVIALDRQARAGTSSSLTPTSWAQALRPGCPTGPTSWAATSWSRAVRTSDPYAPFHRLFHENRPDLRSTSNSRARGPQNSSGGISSTSTTCVSSNIAHL